ncbi:MAG: GreA/GreB family elongation factor [Candidatus Pacebacteria bacterium]|nr:GreA/GreB family elongation factor [Candidatus Paceibacterota bacterium]
MSTLYYVTKEKIEGLQREYDSLKNFLREESQEVPTVLEGENPNPDFATYRENLEEVNSRLVELENILKNHIIIQTPPQEDRDRVNLGAKVVLKDGDSQKAEFRIVGTIEANPFEGKISNESPAGMAFIGKKVGDTVYLGPNANYKILKIQYEDV